MCLFAVLLKFQAALKFQEFNYKLFNKKGYKNNEKH